MRLIKLIKNPYASLVYNFVYAIGNCALGFLIHSMWFITVGSYFIILSVTRFSVLKIKKKAESNPEKEKFVMRTTGVLLLLMSYCLIGVNVLSAIKERGIVFNEIIMISIATYTFTKIVVSIIGIVKARKGTSLIEKALRNISFADAVVSVYTLQRSMLVSFPGMKMAEIKLFNILTGTAVWLIVLFLGINLIGGKKVNMAKSKIVKVNEKIGKTVTDGYKVLEKSVVNTYKKVEKSFVGGYEKIEDKFVDAYLKKDGESVEEAKKRLKEETSKK